MKIIGLTGGMGAGKSTASAYLKAKGFPVIDADEISRSMTEKESPVLAQLTERFGATILTQDGSLDRKRLAALVFQDPEKRRLLDELMHEKILGEIACRCAVLEESKTHDLCFIDAPLLFETDLHLQCDTTWLLVADTRTKMERIQQRDQLPPQEIQARMNSQMSDEEKRKLAGAVVDNGDTKAQLYQKLDELLSAELFFT